MITSGSSKKVDTKKKNTLSKITKNSFGMEFVLINAGIFLMGTHEDESEREFDEDLHLVKISTPFYIQTTPVTQKQWMKVMDKNPSVFTGNDNLPVENVSWSDARRFISRLNKLDGKKEYSLPSEAQWEYTCRAGSKTAYCFGDNPDGLSKYGWFDDKCTHPVGQKKCNSWGLYDMHGNVWEWCQDGYGDYPSKSVIDPLGKMRGWGHVFRGGSCLVPAYYCRSAVRGHNDPGNITSPMGFRLISKNSI